LNTCWKFKRQVEGIFPKGIYETARYKLQKAVDLGLLDDKNTLIQPLIKPLIIPATNGMGHKATTGKEEDSIYGGHPWRRKIDMERLIQLYDGPAWVIQKGNQNARQVCLLYKLSAIVLCDGPGLSSPSPGLTWSTWESLI